MALKYGKFELPIKIKIDEADATKTFARFTAEPFERGFGHTIGNSMRRMLLSSLEAPAIISLRIEGVPHEYMAVEGIVEDMTNIILNIKGAKLRKLPKDDEKGARGQRIVTSTIEVTRDQLDQNGGEVIVKLCDVIETGIFEVVNPELHLFTVTKPMKRQIDLRVAFGRGYVPTERLEVKDKVADEILIDAAFSPVRLVNYWVENTRVGQDTDFDKLILEVTTDGRILPSEALCFCAQIAQKHYDVFDNLDDQELNFEEEEVETDGDKEEILEKLCLRIDEIELSVRSTNCLSSQHIETIAELVSIPERKMLEFRNFGKKSLNEIKDKLTSMGLSLGMDLSAFGITSENVKDKVKELSEKINKKKSQMDILQ